LTRLTQILAGKSCDYESRPFGEAVQSGDVIVMRDVRKARFENGRGPGIGLAQKRGAMARPMQAALETANSGK
jgi:hypothetical protein